MFSVRRVSGVGVESWLPLTAPWPGEVISPLNLFHYLVSVDYGLFLVRLLWRLNEIMSVKLPSTEQVLDPFRFWLPALAGFITRSKLLAWSKLLWSYLAQSRSFLDPFRFWLPALAGFITRSKSLAWLVSLPLCSEIPGAYSLHLEL